VLSPALLDLWQALSVSLIALMPASVEGGTLWRFIIKPVCFVLELDKQALRVKEVACGKPVEFAARKSRCLDLVRSSRQARDNRHGYVKAPRRAGLDPLSYHVLACHSAHGRKLGGIPGDFVEGEIP
jgi:hypothetical protein